MLENVFVSADDDVAKSIVAILRGYFPGRRVSIGSLCRKAFWLLMDLASLTKTKWELSFSYDELYHRFSALFTTHTDQGSYFMTALMDAPNKSSISNSRTVLDNLFEKDSWVPFPVHQASFDVLTDTGKFLVIKAKFTDNWTILVIPEKRSFTQWLRGCYHRLFAPEGSRSKVLAASVDQYVDADNYQHLKHWIAARGKKISDIAGSQVLSN